MTNHPIFAMRDYPAPEIDVSRPAVPKTERCDYLEREQYAFQTESAPQMPEVATPGADNPGRTPSAAADHFEPGDRVMCPSGPRIFAHYGPLASNNRVVAWADSMEPGHGYRWWLIEEIRRPTAQELLEHWGEPIAKVLP